MVMKISYIALSLAALGLLLVEAPRGGLLTLTPDKEAVKHEAGKPYRYTPRSRGLFVAWGLGYAMGGYHGGK